MSMILNEAWLSEYGKEDTCPFCDACFAELIDAEIENDEVQYSMKCKCCGKEWINVEGIVE